MKKYMRKFAMLASIAMLSACGDKTPEEAQKEKFDQTVSHLSQFSGTYKGSIQVQSETIPMEVTLDVDASNTSTNAEPSLTGSVTLYGEAPASARITSSRFTSARNTNTGTLGGVITVTNASGAVVGTLGITGTISGSQFTGVINPQGRPGVSGSFNVSKGGSFPGGQPSTDPTNPRRGVELFAQNYSEPCDRSHPLCRGGQIEHSVQLAIRRFNAAGSESFFYHFVQQRTATVMLTFDGVTRTFATAQYDQQLGKIYGDTVEAGIAYTLDCRRQALDQQTTGWACHFTARENLAFDFLLAPVPQR